MAFLAGLFSALGAGTFVEWSLHWSLHGPLLHTWVGKFHALHHADGGVKPLWQELLTYQVVALAIMPFGALGGFGFWGGWCAGAVGYASLVGATHWWRHTKPDCYHATHHHYPRTNYGVMTSFWDRVFRTRRVSSGR